MIESLSVFRFQIASPTSVSGLSHRNSHANEKTTRRIDRRFCIRSRIQIDNTRRSIRASHFREKAPVDVRVQIDHL